jgi:hypothetical protein
MLVGISYRFVIWLIMFAWFRYVVKSGCISVLKKSTSIFFKTRNGSDGFREKLVVVICVILVIAGCFPFPFLLSLRILLYGLYSIESRRAQRLFLLWLFWRSSVPAQTSPQTCVKHLVKLPGRRLFSCGHYDDCGIHGCADNRFFRLDRRERRFLWLLA